MKKTYMLIPAVALLGLVGAGTASAFGGPHQMISADPNTWATQFEEKMKEGASILGIDVSELKSGWAQGKSIHEIATEKGISEEELRTRIQTKRSEQTKQYLQALVDKGVITQAQADARLKFMEEKMKNNQNNAKGMMKRGGMGRMMR